MPIAATPMPDVSDVASLLLFSGPGGSTLGVRNAGITRTVGVEWEASAVATARAAGMTVEHADVRTLSPCEVLRKHAMDGMTLLLQASPPCQGLSLAGAGKGREDLIHLLSALDQLVHVPIEDAGPWIATMLDLLTEKCSDERSPLTFEVMRWIVDLRPEHISLEQVPAALPVWEAIARVLVAWGYGVWSGNVYAEQFGVPQTRKRAILLARRGGAVTPPVPTHSKYHNRTPGKLDPGVPRWVSMAEALGWGTTPRPDGRYDHAGRPVTHMGDVRNRNGCVRPLTAPSATITASMDNGNFQYVNREALIAEVTPRVNNQSGTEFDLAWPADRPAPVVAGRDIITMPGANANRFNGSTKSRNDGIRVTVPEAGILQSFPADYPWTGTKTTQHQQVGNAVPPLLQEALTRHLLTLPALALPPVTVAVPAPAVLPTRADVEAHADEQLALFA